MVIEDTGDTSISHQFVERNKRKISVGTLWLNYYLETKSFIITSSFFFVITMPATLKPDRRWARVISILIILII